MIKYKIIEIAGNCPSDDILSGVVKQVKAVYANGKKESLKDEEFKKILEDFSLLPEKETAHIKCNLTIFAG